MFMPALTRAALAALDDVPRELGTSTASVCRTTGVCGRAYGPPSVSARCHSRDDPSASVAANLWEERGEAPGHGAQLLELLHRVGRPSGCGPERERARRRCHVRRALVDHRCSHRERLVEPFDLQAALAPTTQGAPPAVRERVVVCGGGGTRSRPVPQSEIARVRC